MSIKLWLCKRLTKRIEKREQQILEFEIAIDTLNRWIKQDKKRLQERLKCLSNDENIRYGIECGFIGEVELKAIRKVRK